MKFMPTVCVDTNIWVYALAPPQANDVNKQASAKTAIKSAGKITLMPQIINELGFVLIRKHGWTNDDLQIVIEDLLKQCTLHIPSSYWHLHALQLRKDYSLSYWDSLVVAAALEAGCNTLLSEDMQHQQNISGLKVENPLA
jgi:predicted nucleic acid-binding protein